MLLQKFPSTRRVRLQNCRSMEVFFLGCSALSFSSLPSHLSPCFWPTICINDSTNLESHAILKGFIYKMGFCSDSILVNVPRCSTQCTAYAGETPQQCYSYSTMSFRSCDVCCIHLHRLYLMDDTTVTKILMSVSSS